MVEMALVLPILLLGVMGILDFGRAYFSWVIITNAAREGARAAALGQDYDQVLAAVAAAAAVLPKVDDQDNPGYPYSSCPPPAAISEAWCVQADGLQEQRLQAAVVTVQYNFEFMALGFLVPSMANMQTELLPVTAQATMRLE